MNLANPAIDFGRAIAGDLGTAERREWIVTNELGGFASGTVAGVATRRYHGLLVAALQPPVGRRMLVASLDATARYGEHSYELFTNRWADGTTAPAGYVFVERFYLEGTTPVWAYALADALLEKRIWMERGANRTYVSFTLARATASVQLQIDAFVNDRDFHALTSGGDRRMQIERIENGVRVIAHAGATPFEVTAERTNVTPQHIWYRNYLYVEERARGLEAVEDRLMAATFEHTLQPGETITFAMGVTPAAPAPAIAPPALSALPLPPFAPSTTISDALERRRAHERDVIARFKDAFPEEAARAPSWIRQLVLAANQFLVARPLATDAEARSVIAGYPWFGDWGRDTMIALPGLCLATGNADVAQRILATFARYIDGGMLPNYFPDAGTAPEYNTVDAALWFIEAVRLTLRTTGDVAFSQRIWPALVAIVRAYRSGTRFAIREDPADGLIFAGEPGVALTWMDAKVGEWVVTPRIGKPVEINALWLRAQATLAELAERLGDVDGANGFRASADRTRLGFQRYWNEECGYLYDVLDGPAGNDATLRPNQLFAVSLPIAALTQSRQRAVVDACARELQTTMGLRSLGSSDARYRARYGGSPLERDGAYHEGTVWAWLAGPFAFATARAYGDSARGLACLEALGREIDAYGVGTLCEIADGAPPHVARGAIAQAWSVGEVLRAWLALSNPGPCTDD